MQCDEIFLAPAPPVGVWLVMELVEVTTAKSRASAIANPGVDLPLLDGPRMQTRVPRSSRVTGTTNSRHPTRQRAARSRDQALR